MEARGETSATGFWKREVVEGCVDVADLVSPSKLADFVVNPYVGCPHACRYCYARFTTRFRPERPELWGDFVDVKRCSKPLGAKRLTGKTVFMSSVTDAYNPAERKYGATRRILEELAPIDCFLSITTKSNLILRDLDLLQARAERGLASVSISLNTLDDAFRSEMDAASSVAERLETLRVLSEAGVPTVLFMSPIFPFVTDFRALVEAARPFVGEVWFENLKLRRGYKEDILSYIRARFPQLYAEYLKIYRRGDVGYWSALKEEIADYCERTGVPNRIFFHY